MQFVRSLTRVLALAVTCSTTLAFADGAPIVHGSVQITTYDGVTDDLLSAGLNQAGLVSAVPPGFVDPLNPTPAELRRRAIHGNYRGIVDTVPGGGMGLLWGPQSPGTPVFPDATFGLIPGVEYKAYLRAPEAHGHINNVPAAVQIPRHFNPSKPCIVAAAPSGSRSLYGGIAIAEWGLFKGCAIALPGKGTDTGFHLLGPEAANYAVDDLNGVYGRAETIGDDAQFALRPSPKLNDYIDDNPYRVATKHAHSQINPERLWGRFAWTGSNSPFGR
jgi:hydroxybutyrate-dimer hydrolase